MKQKIVVIGGGAAGPKITAKLLRTTKFESQVDLYTDEDIISYSACGMPYFIEGLIENPERLIVRTPQQFEEKGANIHLNKRCVKIIPEEKKIIVQDTKTYETEYVSYDKLAITTGARPFIPQIQNMHLSNVFTLRKLQDAINIKNALKESKKAVIVGGGYIGIEMLEACAANGLDVTLVESSPYILPIFDEDFSEKIREKILEITKDKYNVNIVTSDCVVTFQGEDRVRKVITSSGNIFDADMVIVAAGVVPNTEIARDAGIELGVNSAIRVNNRMETSIKDIYAAGDCIENFHVVSRRHVWVPLGSSANKEGRCAAINIANEYDAFPGILGSSVTKFMKLTMSFTGLNERDAQKYGFEPVCATVSQKDRAGYMPEAQAITLKLVADRRTEKILGAQAIGEGDADKRINTVASAITANLKVGDLFNLDMTYAPPFSTAVDALLSAAMIIYNDLHKCP
ncbi:TPA: FAD-dependent oxidoreductase [Candidatus Spyradomonas excrementavium]|nr:FAD-dependent oxidoreductase [Candidatus Spyradomonas excrementavium]